MACVSLLNYGVTKSSFLAACLRETQLFLANFNIEIRAEYVPSAENKLADLCSRAFTNNVFYKNFNDLLNNGTLVLDYVYYNKFDFEYDI